jgi:YesN/AraC family two-component response regulator
MEISYTSDSRYDIGEDVPVPMELQKYQVCWATESLCRKYHCGYVYTQTFSCARFDMHFRIYRMKQADQFYVLETHPSIYLYYLLRGQIHATLKDQQVLSLTEKSCGLHYQAKGANIIQLEAGVHQVISFRLKPSYVQDIAASTPLLASTQQLLEESPCQDVSLLHTVINTGINQELIRLFHNGVDSNYKLFKLYSILDNLLGQYVHIMETRDDQAYEARYHVLDSIHSSIIEAPNNAEHQLKYLAAQYKIDPRELSKHYKRKYNEWLEETLREHLMIRAMAMITETTQSFEEISSLLGYADRRIFSRAIKRELGDTPDELRKRYCSKAPSACL